MRKLLVALTSLLLVAGLAGCGGSGGSGGSEGSDAEAAMTTTADEGEATTSAPDGEAAPVAGRDDYVAAMADNLSSGSEDDGQLVLERDQAECMAPRWVDAITVELLQAQEVTPAELADPDFSASLSDLALDADAAGAMVDAFDACDVDLVGLFASAFTQGLGEDVTACVAQEADPALIRDVLVASFSGGDGETPLTALLDQLRPVCDLPDA
ncbi:MAG: hypothetical protein R2702_07050 [Acidimicrobiales bacterium]